MEKTDLNLVGGGLLYRVLPRRLAGRTSLIIGGGAVAWLPLLILCLIKGHAWDAELEISFLSDPVPYGRFLIAFPVFVAAGSLLTSRLSDVVSYLWGSGIVAGDDRQRFQSALRDANRRCDSVVADLVALAVAYGAAWMVTQGEVQDGISTWFAYDIGAGEQLTPAGWWYSLVSLPLWQAVFFGWVWRIVVWWRFLWRVSRLNLRLLPTHPDRAGGLGILEMGQSSMSILIFATSAVLSACLADEIYGGAVTLVGTAPTIAVFVVLSLLFVVVPLFSFTRGLFEANCRGLVEYGDLADDLFGAFDNKWAHKDDAAQRKLLGNPDPSSLADYGYAYEVVTEMRIIPFSRKSAMSMVLYALIPFSPLLLLNYSVKEIVQRILG